MRRLLTLEPPLSSNSLLGGKPLAGGVETARGGPDALFGAFLTTHLAAAPAIGPIANPETATMTPYDYGRLAALRGQYRIVACPESDEHLREWERGYDSVPAAERGSQPPPAPPIKRCRRRRFAAIAAGIERGRK